MAVSGRNILLKTDLPAIRCLQLYLMLKVILWCGTNAGVSKYDGTTWTNYDAEDGLIDNNVHSIGIDSAGNYWFGTENGVSKFDGSAGQL